MNTQFLKAYLVVPGVTLFAVLSVWFVVKSRQPHRFQIALAVGTVAVAGGIVIIGTSIVAGEALVTAVSAGVTWTLLGAWIAMLTLDLPSKRQKALRWLVWGMFGIGLLGPLLLLTNDRGLALLGGICWMPLIGHMAAWMGVLAALSLALALDQNSTFRWTWTLTMVWTVGWSLAVLWVIAGTFSERMFLWISIAVIIAFIAAIAVLGPAIAKQVKTGERPFPRMLLFVGVVQGTTNFAGANLTDAILTGTNAANTNLREALLRSTHFEDGVSLENTHQLADILDEHPGLPELLKQQDRSKQPRVLWVWLVLVGYLGFLAFVNYSEGTWLSPREVIGILRSSTYLQRVLDGFSSHITALAISPDGKLLASGHYNGTVELQDIKTGQTRHTLTGHSARVDAVVISADGQTLASSSSDGMVKLWDLGTGQLIRTFHEDGTQSSVISADGQTFATRNKDDIIQLRELPTGQLLQTLSVNQRGGWFILSLDGQLLIDFLINTADVWDLKTGQLLHTLTGNRVSFTRTLVISSDGQTLISVYRDRENPIGEWSRQGSIIELWDLTTGHLKQTRRVHGWIDAIAISPDGQILAGCDDLDDIIKVWDLHTGQLLYVLPKLLHSFDYIAISPDGQFLAISSYWGQQPKIALWRLVIRSL